MNSLPPFITAVVLMLTFICSPCDVQSRRILSNPSVHHSFSSKCVQCEERQLGSQLNIIVRNR